MEGHERKLMPLSQNHGLSDLDANLTFQMDRSVNWLRDYPFRKAGPPLRKWVHLKPH